MKKIYMVETLYDSDGYCEYFDNKIDAYESFYDNAKNKYIVSHLYWRVDLYSCETNTPFEKFQAYEKDCQKLCLTCENMKNYMNDDDYDIDDDYDFKEDLENFLDNNIDHIESEA